MIYIILIIIYGSTVLVMLNNQSEGGNREQGKEAIFCNNVQNYGLFLMYSKLSEIFWI
ncbi:hypothetical protein NIES806_10050 [Dolichospermum compactum NIES-806]|uniref:Uncharacterized protein n=1 Tax=Dolichospermum compactum NIES-806 TaxID=1973481 RepID=A0A1Z4UZV8_9CYAN|nr:hypothetical protein NIES806_10050 [Dolichospermum compactum NIES-806]